MRVVLTSRDEKLSCLVSEIVGPDLHIHDGQGSVLPEGDVYIWDVEEGFEVAHTDSGRHLFLVDRRQIESLGQQLGDMAACIVLKPAIRPTLEAFLSGMDVQALQLDRDALLENILRVNLKLQEYDQDRTNFLARGLHDLRAPLTALHGYCGLLAAGELGQVNARQEELLQRMKGSTQRLSKLIASVFELSIAGRVERKLYLEQGDIEACVNQALNDVSAYLQEKQISITVQLDPPEQGLFIETAQIEQLLLNLLENACKFTPKRGSIEIQGISLYWDSDSQLDDSACAANAYRIEIKDSGPGIDPSRLQTIFEEYTSYSGANDRSAGLGLAICRMIVNTHGGKLWAESSKEGATFIVILPFEPRRGLRRPQAKKEAEFAQVRAS